MTTITEMSGYPKNIRQAKNIDAEKSNLISGSKGTIKSDGLTEAFNKTDSVEISKTAQLAFSNVSDVKKYSAIIKQNTGLSRSQLETIKERMDSGYYDKPEIVSVIASRLSETKSGGDSDLLVQEKINSDPRTAVYERIYTRIQKGFYDSQEVRNEIAAKMIDPDYI